MNYRQYYHRLLSRIINDGAFIEDPSNENGQPFLLSNANGATKTDNYLLLVSPDAFYNIVNLDDELEEIASDEKRPLISIHSMSSD